MTNIKPSLHSLSVWRIRLLLCAILPAFFSAYFIAHRGLLWWVYTIIWLALFFYLYIIYFPIMLRKLCYSGNEHCLLIHCGVIYTRIKALPYRGIQYVSIITTPLERCFGICSLKVNMAGAGAYLPGLTLEQAQSLRDYLNKRDSEDAV